MLQSQMRRVVCGVTRLFIMKNAASRKGLSQYGTPDAIRTHDLQSRSLTLYPAELQAHPKIREKYTKFSAEIPTTILL